MRLLKHLLLLFIFCSFNQAVFAQDGEDGNNTVAISIPEVALMDIESEAGQSISLIIEAPSEAGLMIDLTAAVDSSLWLNYSSVRSVSNEATRNIFAKVVGGSVPAGLKLRVKPQPYTGNGDGQLGVPSNGTNGRVLVSTDRRIIRSIKTCYTGDGVGNGHRLIYSLEYRNNQYNKIDFDDSNTVTVLYTITDN